MSLVAPGQTAVNASYAPTKAGSLSGDMYSHPIFGGVRLSQYTDITGPDGTMPRTFQSRTDNRGLEALRSQAVGGETPWLNPALGESREAAQFSRQDAAKKSAQALRRPMSAQQTKNTLKQQGQQGRQLDSGEMQNAYSLMGQANQSAGRNLMQQTGRELQATQPQRFNIGNALTERNLKDEHSFGNYEEMMRAYAARQQAQAELDAGGSGGLLGFVKG